MSEAKELVFDYNYVRIRFSFLHQGIGIPVMFWADIIASEFEFQSHYYVNFQTYTLGKDMNFLIPQGSLDIMA